MYSKVTSGAIDGITCRLIKVEVDISTGLPCFDMVGLLGSEVKEAKERVRVALRNCNTQMPPQKITVNLSPANVRKAGSGFDLPIAMGILLAKKEEEAGTRHLENQFIACGELGLNGEILPIHGVLAIARTAKEQEISYCIVPEENAWEAELIPGLKVIGVHHLKEVIALLENPIEQWGQIYKNNKWTDTQAAAQEHIESKTLCPRGREKEETTEDKVDFSQIYGQHVAKRCAMIAAAGFHHLLLVGPPGAGKSTIAKRIPTIMPKLTYEESLQVSILYSIMGILEKGDGLLKERPFQSPHHSITEKALVGGGMVPVPGVISRSHKGILFLDEFAEFKRTTLDLLRQPMEDKKIQIARNQGVYEYPTDFMLVAAMNPCPCGYFPDRNRCQCTGTQIKKYLSSISGPILDRIDLSIEINEVDYFKERTECGNMDSKSMGEKVKKAREMQKRRFANTPYIFNGELQGKAVEKYCPLEGDTKQFMEQVYHSLGLSVRGYLKICKVARTIADLEESETIERKHISEAVCYYTGLREIIGKQNDFR